MKFYGVTIFEVFVLSHLVMDWLVQKEWQALNKSRDRKALASHALTYSLGFIPAFLIFKTSVLWLVLIFLSHLFLDQRGFEKWWLEKIKGMKKDQTPDHVWHAVLIGADQTFHLLVLAFVAFLQ